MPFPWNPVNVTTSTYRGYMFSAHQAAQSCSSCKNPFIEVFSTGDSVYLTGVVLSSQVWLPGKENYHVVPPRWCYRQGIPLRPGAVISAPPGWKWVGTLPRHVCVSETQVPWMDLTKEEAALRTDKLVTGTNKQLKVIF